MLFTWKKGVSLSSKVRGPQRPLKTPKEIDTKCWRRFKKKVEKCWLPYTPKCVCMHCLKAGGVITIKKQMFDIKFVCN